MIAKYIDWGPFFQTWDLHGPFPQILADEVVGEHARQVFAEGEKMLERIVAERWLTANAVVAFFPANAVGDDIEIYTDDIAPRRCCSPGTACASRRASR